MILRLFLVAWTLAALLPLQAADGPLVTAQSVLLFDANTGRVIYKKNENDHRPVASTQKLLTALIVAETGDLDKEVVIQKSDTEAAPTKLNLRPGEVYTRRTLLTALLVKSANDVACALARDNAGSIGKFAERMNARMALLGGRDSNFVNPNGLPSDEQYSTARDMARVARMVYFNPVLRDIVSTRVYPFSYARGRTVTLHNTNRVLRTYSFCNGMKTGYTDAARHCLISSGSWNGRDVIAVVYGDSKARIWDESARMLAYGLGMNATEMASLKLKPSQSDEE